MVINDVGLRTSITLQAVGEIFTNKKRLKEVNRINLKHVDGLLLAKSINLNLQLVTVPTQERVLPDQYYARAAEDNQMQLNLKKTKLMLFNPSRSRDFMPQFKIEDNEVQLVEETRLLGVTINSSAHVDDLVMKCNKKFWRLGADTSHLKDIYEKQIRRILKHPASVWNPAITGDQGLKVERIKQALLLLGQLR